METGSYTEEMAVSWKESGDRTNWWDCFDYQFIYASKYTNFLSSKHVKEFDISYKLEKLSLPLKNLTRTGVKVASLSLYGNLKLSQINGTEAVKGSNLEFAHLSNIRINRILLKSKPQNKETDSLGEKALAHKWKI